MNSKQVLPILIFSLFGYLMLTPSCANTSAPPSGGRKDTIPPILLRTNPAPNSVLFKGKRIELTFNEYVKLNDATNQIYLSPPQSKRPVAVVKGKSVVVTFSQLLDSATTYNLQFGRAIQDNNEGNPFGAYSFSFSTGSELDSLVFSGYIADAQTLMPIENASILLHTNLSDTAVYKTLPKALGKTDRWGYFYLPNLKPIPYRVFAVEDQNRNNKFDPDNETIAFLETLFVPLHLFDQERRSEILVDAKDTLSMLNRPIEQTLYLFKEKPKRQILRDKARPQARMFYFTFSAPSAQVLHIDIQGVDSSSIIHERTFWGDTLRYWIRDLSLPDTLRGTVRYLKTDSLNQLSPAEERFNLTLPKEEANNRNRLAPRGQQPQEEKKDILKIELIARGEWVEQQGIEFVCSAYPLSVNTESIALQYSTPRNEIIKLPFTLQKDSLDGCRYYLQTQKWIPETEYTLVVLQNTFTDVYGFANDSLSQKVTIPDPGKFGSITVILKGGEGSYIVELLPETRDKITRTLYMKSGETGIFPYLADGNYVIRITEDKNGNKVWDTGDFALGLLPERVRFYQFSNGTDIIEITDKLELEQTIDLDELFSHDVAPAIPPKTSR
ncbi:MAG: Ig-like domain-containing protein, partial [Bacteroidetes bacterium]|nr:Ig-like domain-containing protein [Bacteroidota bacterium]